MIPQPTETFSKGGPWILCECCHGTGKANPESAEEEGMTLVEYIEEFGDVCRNCEGGGWTWPLGEAVLSCNADVSECAKCGERRACKLTAGKATR